MTAFRLLSTFAVLALSLVGGVNGQGKGYHSDHFDPKYFLARENLITPLTHPALFTFDGRWMERHEAFQASTWQGNSFTALIFGTKCNLQLRPIPQGKVKAYTFYIQVDGGPLRGMQIDGFDTSAPEHEIMQVSIDLGVSDSVTSKILAPHTVRFVSIPETPLRFEGIWIENTMIKQGFEWIDSQNSIPSVEFIGNDGDVLIGRSIVPISGEKTYRSSSSALANNAQWKASESLGIRHSHIDSGICLTSSCNPSNPLPGLESQYFMYSPLNSSLPFTRSTNIANTDPKHPKNFEIPWHFHSPTPGNIRTKTPDYLILDLGLLDTVIHRVPTEKFSHSLLLFLARLLTQSYPSRRILVLTRPSGGMTHDNTLIPPNAETRSTQDALHTATLTTIKRLTDADPLARTLISIHTITPSSNPVLDLEKLLCRTVVPPPPTSFMPAFVKTDEKLTKAQRRCSELGSLRARVNIVEDVTSGDVLWTLGLFVLAGGALWVARDTLLGACSFVLGRRSAGEGGEGWRKMG